MFEIGGITDIDKNWLLFSIYNSGENLVGAKYEKDLEHFLSIFAVSLMFDDAGEQATYIKQQSDNIKQEITPHFLHLYLLNGTYFPASYILQLTYDNLLRIYSKMDNYADKILSTGSTVDIENHLTHADIQGTRSINTGRIYTLYPKDWINTFSVNHNKVKLNIHFLAGFLDIIAELEDFKFGK